MMTDEFKQFAKDYKAALERGLPENLCIKAFNVGHFYVSGFITEKQCIGCTAGTIRDCDRMVNKIVDKCNGPFYIYFSCSDVRHWRNAWYNNILIRTAKSDKDYTGGSNGYTTLEKFGKEAERIMKRQKEVNM